MLRRPLRALSICLEAATVGVVTTAVVFFALARIGPTGPRLVALAALLGLVGFALTGVVSYLLTIRNGRAFPVVRALLDPPILP